MMSNVTSDKMKYGQVRAFFPLLCEEGRQRDTFLLLRYSIKDLDMTKGRDYLNQVSKRVFVVSK